MSSRFAAGLTAVLVTVLSVCCLGVLVGGFDFFVVEGVERALENIGILPKGWGQLHASVLYVIATATTLPPVLWLGILLLRQAYRIECQFDDASFGDPEGQK